MKSVIYRLFYSLAVSIGMLVHGIVVNAQSIDASIHRPIIVLARVLDVNRVDGANRIPDAYAVEVEEAWSEDVPRVLLTRVTEQTYGTLSIARVYGRGDLLHMVLESAGDGSYTILSLRPAPATDVVDDPTPGGIVTKPWETPDHRSRAYTPPSPSFEQQVVEIVNQERWNNGQLPPLRQNHLLDSSSEGHSSRMAFSNFFAHCDLDDGSSPFERMTDAGYIWNSAAENIAAGYSTPASAMAGWMASSGHRTNILSSSKRELGVGYVYDSGDTSNVRYDSDRNCVADSSNNGPFRRYWTQNFGRRSNVYPIVVNREAYQTDSHWVDLYVYGEGFAQNMRFANENEPWSQWQPYNPNVTWTLSAADGTKEVFVEIQNGSGSVLGASDTIELTAGCVVSDVDLEVPSQSTSSSETFEACSSVSLNADFEVSYPADVTIRAPLITIGAGFSVEYGARFTAVSEVPGAP